MKYDDFERKNPVGIKPKNPFVVRCDVILLKHALTKIESELQTRIVTGFNLVNIEPAIGHIREAKNAVIIALQENCFSAEIMFPVAGSLHSAYKQAPLPEILATWEHALDFIADMPIPYRVAATESKCYCGDVAVSGGMCEMCLPHDHESPIGTIVPKKDSTVWCSECGDIEAQPNGMCHWCWQEKYEIGGAK